jgi:Tol biopolymer transport system component
MYEDPIVDEVRKTRERLAEELDFDISAIFEDLRKRQAELGTRLVHRPRKGGAEGGTPRQVTRLGPSYWHGWSPDGKTLTYCAERNGEYDVYTIGVEGGEETRLTTAPGLDDGPEYSPDGRYIYFNSIRTGTMQIWRMKADGSEQQPVTSDEYNNWFPHPSPDGRWIVFLSYEKGVEGHPANKDVTLRLKPTGGGETRVLAELFGGQGTLNVPSWSPDSRRLAFVSYRLTNP